MQCTSKDNYDKFGLWIKGRYPCAKCLACHLRARSEWASRIVLESRCWHNSIFFTLTYSDEHLPADGKLSRTDVRNFIQNWKRQNGHPPRYFIAGEYGTKNKRPHYHGILFGEDSKVTLDRERFRDLRFDKAWQKKGFTDTRDLNSSGHSANVASYIAGYILKGSFLATPDSTHNTEWALMSRNPAIATGAAEKIISALVTRNGVEIVSKLETAPAVFKYGDRSWIMPYRVRKQICKELAIPFKPLNDTIEISIETGIITSGKKRKKTYQEAFAAEYKKKLRLLEAYQTQLTKGKD